MTNAAHIIVASALSTVYLLGGQINRGIQAKPDANISCEGDFFREKGTNYPFSSFYLESLDRFPHGSKNQAGLNLTLRRIRILIFRLYI
jgi:hypothetical protein